MVMRWASRIGRETETKNTGEALPAALRAIPRERIVELDVREALRAGQEPFSQIMAARAQVPPGGALCLRAIFEPVPLYAVLGKQGFTHHTERLAGDDWRIWFYPADAATAPAVGPAASAEGAPPEYGDDVVVLDVRGLEPPEPMLRTLEALESLPAGGTLVQLNSRVPQFLLPMLAERGYRYDIREQSPDLVRLFITREKAEPMTNTRTLDVRVIPPREKHPTIFQTFASLQPGESFVLVNDHDPKPLRYQFEAEHAGEYGWQYLEQGPAVWRVEISKAVR